MFFDAVHRHETGDFSYARSIAAQYGNGGKPFPVTKRPSEATVKEALEFRREERAEFERMKQRLAESEAHGLALYQHFLATQENERGRSSSSGDHDDGRRSNAVLLP